MAERMGASIVSSVARLNESLGIERGTARTAALLETIVGGYGIFNAKSFDPEYLAQVDNIVKLVTTVPWVAAIVGCAFVAITAGREQRRLQREISSYYIQNILPQPQPQEV